MSVGRFIISVIVAFIIYVALYTGLMAFLLKDIYAANAEFFRPQEDGIAMLGMVGHVFQTIIIVALFNLAVGSQDVKAGVRFGLLMGGYLAATDMGIYGGLNLSLAPLPYSIVIHLLVGAIIGAVLAKLHPVPAGADGKEQVAA